MKLKLSPLGNRTILLLIILSMNACQNAEPEAKSHSNQELLSSTAVAESLSVYKESYGSLPAMSDFMHSRYAIDFNAGYERLMPYFYPSHKNEQITTSVSVAIGAVDEILSNMDIDEYSSFYKYLQNVTNLFEGGLLSEDEIVVELKKLKVGILQNNQIDDSEKDKLAIVATLVHLNFTGMVDVVADGDKINSTARTQGWFNKVWRVVRSVVVTAALGAIVGALATDEGGNTIVNAVIGSAIGGVAAAIDATVNDHCHFALQCSGGWRQNCNSGDCEPYIR